MEILELKNSRVPNATEYALVNKGVQIGYGFIKNTEINPIEVYIDENQRSNGYGKYLFAKLVKIVEQKGINVLRFEIDISNYRIKNIIGNLGGQHIMTSNGKQLYILKVD